VPGHVRRVGEVDRRIGAGPHCVQALGQETVEPAAYQFLPRARPALQRLLEERSQLRMLEQEDSEAWAQQYIGSKIDFADDRPYFYGLGEGEEAPHPDMPGLVGTTANEAYARHFFKRWRSALEAVEGE
jgi:hypothetical protein